MFQTPFPVFLTTFSRKFGPPLLVVAAAGLLGALKAPPQPPLKPSPTQTAIPQPPVTSPPSEPPLQKRTISGTHLNFLDEPGYRTLSGNYKVRNYGLKMQIPDGLVAFDGGASHHGFQIPLLQADGDSLGKLVDRLTRLKEPLIGLSFYYNASMTPFEQERDENNWGSTEILQQKKVRIAGMNGDRTQFSEPDGETGETLVIDQIMLGRRWLDGEWHDEHGHRNRLAGLPNQFLNK